MVHAYDSGCMRSHSHHDTRGEEGREGSGGGTGGEDGGGRGTADGLKVPVQKGARTPPIETLSTKH